jgi:acyl dehydratase
VLTFNGITELEDAVGTHLGHSPWHTITQQQINAFADATGDDQWIHTDPARAAVGPFGGTIAHGYLTLSLVPRLLWQIYAVEGVSMSINYGANKLRFPSPVPVGSRVRANAQLIQLTHGPKGSQATVRVTVERHGESRPVCVVDIVTMMIARL